MNTGMAERIRLIVDTEDIIRRAVHLRKVKAGGGQSASEIVNNILREALAKEIAELEEHDQEKPKRRGKRQEGSEDAD